MALFILMNIKSQTIGDLNQDYLEGIDFLNQGNLIMADSLISKCLKQINPATYFQSNIFGNSAPINNIYFNHAIVKLGLHDTCSYCSEMHNASTFNDNDAFSYYMGICISSIDSSFFDKKYKQTSKDKARYISIRYFDKFNNKYFGRVLDTQIKEDNSSKIRLVSFGNIIGLFRIENNDTIFNRLLGYEYLPKFRKWDKDYYSYIESKLIYPEDKNRAYAKYKKYSLEVDYKVLIDETGKAINIELDSFSPNNLDKIYIDEALKVVNQASGYIVPGHILGKDVKSEVIFPIVFKIKE